MSFRKVVSFIINWQLLRIYILILRYSVKVKLSAIMLLTYEMLYVLIEISIISVSELQK